MQEQNQERRQSPDIGNLAPDTESKTVYPTHLKTAAAASNKSASIFSENQHAEQSHETYIINSLREQLMQLGLSKYEIEMEYEKYLPIAARAIIEKPETLCSLRQRLVNDLESVAAQIFKSAETKISNQDDVTLEQEPNKKGGSHSIGSPHTQIESTPRFDENFSTMAADPDLDSQPPFNPTLPEIGYTESVPRSYVAETITKEEQIQIGDALVAATALTTNKFKLNESLSDISAAFCKLAHVLGVKVSENEDYYLVLFEIWRNLFKN